MVSCPKCRKPEFDAVGRMTKCVSYRGEWVLRRIASKWVINPVLGGYREFACPCGFRWKEEAK